MTSQQLGKPRPRLHKDLTVVAMVILLLIAFLSFLNWRRFESAVTSTGRSRQVLEAIGALMNGVKEAEASMRMYLLTGREADLVTFEQQLKPVPAALKKLALVAAPAQKAMVGTINQLTGERLQLLGDGIRVRKERGLYAAAEFVRSSGSLAKMAQLRDASAQLFADEYDEQARSAKVAERRAFDTFLLASVGCLLAFVILLFLQRAVDQAIAMRNAALRDLADVARRLEITLASIGDGVVATDAAGNITLLNPVAERLTGWSYRDAVGRPAQEVLRVSDENTGLPLPNPLGTVLQTGARVDMPPSTVLLPKVGEPVAIADSSSPIRTPAGEIVGAVLVFRDIRESREAQRQIEKWHLLFRASGFGMAIIDSADDTLRSINPAFAAMHGYQEDELLGQNFAILLADNDASPGGWKKTGQVTFESLHRHRDGRLFPVLTDMTTFEDATGRTTERVAYFSDISVRILAERVSQYTQERFKTAVEVVGDIIWTNSARGEMEGEQLAWGNFTGQTFAEYQGFGWSTAIHPDDLEQTLDAWNRAVAEEHKFVIEHRVRRHDGVYRLFAVRALPMRDEQGQIREWVGVHADITDERESHERLSESEGRFRALATALPQVIWSASPDGKFEYVNPSWEAYVGPADQGWQSILHPDDAGLVLPEWAAASQAGRSFEFQARLKRTSDGSYRSFLCRTVPLLNPAGRVVRWFGSCTDVDDQTRRASELNASNEALRRSNTDLEQFAYAASHDLQEPLRMVAIYAQLLNEEYGGRLDEVARSYIDQSLKASRRMETLLQALLSYSLVTAPSATDSQADAAAAAKDALENLESLIARTGAVVTVGELPPVRLPSVRLTQLFQNLIGNSIKYRRDGLRPEIEVAAMRHSSDRWRFSVRDNGMGIAPQYLEQIFGIFKRLHGADYEGTGIGLAICQRIVENTGGKIWAESTAGLGTVLHFTLPSV